MKQETSRRLLPVVVGAVGSAAAVAIASFGRMGISSTAGLLGWTLGGAAASTALAVLLLWLLRRRPVTVQVTVASLAPVVAVAAGVVGGSWTMFISGHDLRTLVVILVGAGTVGVITALVFGSRISRASAGLGELARRIGEQNDAPRSNTANRAISGDAGPGELAGLARDLDAALARLEESRAQAAALEQSRRELVAWVSHDLRTPLAGIRAMVEALEDGVVEDKETVDRYHRTIGLEVERLTSLVADLFELSKIHAGALRLELAPQRLDEVLSDVVAGATLLARAKGVVLGCRLGKRPGGQGLPIRDGPGRPEPHRQRHPPHRCGWSDPRRGRDRRGGLQGDGLGIGWVRRDPRRRPGEGLRPRVPGRRRTVARGRSGRARTGRNEGPRRGAAAAT